MDWLRISLLILGIILIAGIWAAHRVRVRTRRGAWDPEPEDWGDEGIHIRAHRDDQDIEPKIGGETLSLPLEEDDAPLPAPKTRPEPAFRSQTAPPATAPEMADKPSLAVPPAAPPAKARGGRSTSGPRAEPRPRAETLFDDVSEPRVVGRNPLAARAGWEKILILHVVAPRNRPFTGVALGAALRRAGLDLGEMSIYHYRSDSDGGEPLFSVANMVAPGTLTDEILADMMTPGITLFLQVHACNQPQKAFEALLETSHVLARDLGGSILDAQRSTATNQTLAHMREEMNQWLLRHRPELLRRKADR